MIYVDETEEKDVTDIDLAFEPRDVQVKIGRDVKEEYTLQEELGRGKFGTVYKCTEKRTGRRFAAKFIITTRSEDRKEVEREVEIMRMLQQPRLLQLYDAFDDGKKEMCLILELIEGGELFERVISDDFVLTEKACSIFVRQICEGVQYMHSKNVLHLDMKPENILCVTRTGNQIKIIDFGLARKYDPDKKLQVLFGTPEFVAPEVVNFDKVSFTTDMWSVGVICYVLLSGLSPFMGDSDLETMGNVTKAEFDFEDDSFDKISETAKDFISKLLIKDMTLRMNSAQSLKHPWLKKDEPKKDTMLDKKRLKRFVIRRRWQKAVNALLALKAMGATI
ncbi:myosin light chain kinase, smooth muscle-like [Uloborus diversus]|uniref:myosin light chain kinase, smooth muscle-like n=1 Tax=Uloborus diversus TaxID=327109 RepID=UPI002409C98E|nr:myosin light chain kinase, smooth muscle-like [Uloborus diversus]